MKKPKKPTRYKMNGMFRYLLICLMLFTGSAHTAELGYVDSLKKAAEQGDAEAQFFLGHLYDDGDGVPEDDAEAVRWYRKAAEQGNALAQYQLGVMYYRGGGVPQDYAEAVSWFRQGAEQGDAFAQQMLGLMYARGKGVPEDDIQAYAWISIAVAQGREGAKNTKEYLTGEMTSAEIAESTETFTRILGNLRPRSQYTIGIRGKTTMEKQR